MEICFPPIIFLARFQPKIFQKLSFQVKYRISLKFRVCAVSQHNAYHLISHLKEGMRNVLLFLFLSLREESFNSFSFRRKLSKSKFLKGNATVWHFFLL